MSKEPRFKDGVFFTGHRPTSLGGWNEDNDMARDVKGWLFKAIQRAIDKDKKTFITGMACGIDIWGAEAVLALKGEHHDLRLIAAIPYMSQAERWAKFNKTRWRRLMETADEVHILYDDPPKESPTFEFAKRLNGRNEWMVDAAVVGISVFTGVEKGGTYNCLAYAKKTGKKVLIYNPVTKEEAWR